MSMHSSLKGSSKLEQNAMFLNVLNALIVLKKMGAGKRVILHLDYLKPNPPSKFSRMAH